MTERKRQGNEYAVAWDNAATEFIEVLSNKEDRGGIPHPASSRFPLWPMRLQTPHLDEPIIGLRCTDGPQQGAILLTPQTYYETADKLPPNIEPLTVEETVQHLRNRLEQAGVVLRSQPKQEPSRRTRQRELALV